VSLPPGLFCWWDKSEAGGDESLLVRLLFALFDLGKGFHTIQDTTVHAVVIMERT
jgi:hypothetical protein